MNRHKILALDSAGTPRHWLTVEDALYYYAKDRVAWVAGTSGVVCRGGTSRRTGERTLVEVNSIISVKGADFMTRDHGWAPAVSKDMLLVRDRNTCAYCGGQFKSSELDAEHIYPDARGGAFSWMNLVAACSLSPPNHLPV